MKIIEIEYTDSNIINEQTSEIVKPEIIQAVGYLIKDGQDYITIAREVIKNEYRGQLSIPRVAIIHIK